VSFPERLSRVAVIPVAPVIFAQGKRLRRVTPILPDAALPWVGSLAGPNPLRLLVLGDSTAVGVGTDTQENGLPGNLARELQARWNRGVEWTAVGESGATARDIVERFLAEATTDSYDFVFLTVGSNDALKLRSRGAFGRDIRLILTALRAASPEAVLMMSSLPAFYRFELLPNPLRRNLYLHSRSLEAEARAVVAGFEKAIMTPKPPPYTDGFFASDLFHPSGQGYRDWAHFAIDDAFSSGQLA
jgi:lysophospholipase L1-like esterase